VGLIDTKLTGIEDSLLLISDKNEEFIIDIPAHKFKIAEDVSEYSVKSFMVSNSKSAEDLKDPLVLPIAIRFNEKTSR
jgi:hypothetical protein